MPFFFDARARCIFNLPNSSITEVSEQHKKKEEEENKKKPGQIKPSAEQAKEEGLQRSAKSPRIFGRVLHASRTLVQRFDIESYFDFPAK